MFKCSKCSKCSSKNYEIEFKPLGSVGAWWKYICLDCDFGWWPSPYSYNGVEISCEYCDGFCKQKCFIEVKICKGKEI